MSDRRMESDAALAQPVSNTDFQPLSLLSVADFRRPNYESPRFSGDPQQAFVQAASLFDADPNKRAAMLNLAPVFERSIAQMDRQHEQMVSARDKEMPQLAAEQQKSRADMRAAAQGAQNIIGYIQDPWDRKLTALWATQYMKVEQGSHESDVLRATLSKHPGLVEQLDKAHVARGRYQESQVFIKALNDETNESLANRAAARLAYANMLDASGNGPKAKTIRQEGNRLRSQLPADFGKPGPDDDVDGIQRIPNWKPQFELHFHSA